MAFSLERDFFVIWICRPDLIHFISLPTVNFTIQISAGAPSLGVLGLSNKFRVCYDYVTTNQRRFAYVTTNKSPLYNTSFTLDKGHTSRKSKRN